MRIGMNEDMGGHIDSGDEANNALDFEEVKGPIQTWLKKPEVIKFIKRCFNNFLS
jgi:hypothetical protein